MTDHPNPAPLSVIIPAYRAEGTIDRALASVAAQSIKPYEVIVVDDGSPDGTLKAAQGMSDSMGSIKLKIIGQENKGAGAARNRALQEASQEYVAFLDADDEWMPEKIEQSLEWIKSSDNVFVAHDLIQRNEDGTEQDIKSSERFKNASDPYIALYRTGFVGSITVVARRQAIEAAGGFDETLPTGQDFDLWLSMLASPQTRFLVFDQRLSRYYISASGITSHTARRLDCTLRIAIRHFPALKSRTGSPWTSLWFRILAIHMEAYRAFRASGKRLQALKVCLMLPVNMVSACWQVSVPVSRMRQNT
ncbi:MAG: glycosyltransferase family 2 protein [Rhodospirillales bacterium]|nr:glycosyltransferase family 2 protein [Rhodospirillales bacterium]